MEPFKSHEGLVALLDRQHVDTDQIIPKQFLKRIERTGFGKFLFYDWRFLADGKPNPEFELNQARYQGASILITRQNFGCGSSREHAPWALQDYGFKVIISPSFADIFYNNCFKNGMLPIVLPPAVVEELFREVQVSPGYRLTVSLPKQTITMPSEKVLFFDIDPFRKYCLENGLDDIALTLLQEANITAYEKAHSK